MSVLAFSSTEKDLQEGLLWTVQYTTGTVAGGGLETIAWEIGPKPVIFQNRTYGGSMSDALISLYEDTFTGGTPIPAGNRNLAIALPGPVSYFHTVTGTPTNFKTSIRLFATGGLVTSQIGVTPEGEWYMLKANTKYLLTIKNMGTLPGILNFRYTYKAIG